MTAALLVLLVLAVVAIIAIVWPLTCAQAAPEGSLEAHADEIIAQLDRPDLDLRWTALDDVQAHRAADGAA